MNEITFSSLNEFYIHLQTRGGANASHGPLGTFYSLMGKYLDPNTCSCKKGKGMLDTIINSVRAMNALSGDKLVNAKSLFDNTLVIVKDNGSEVARF